ncbi:MAG: hypothetical protein ABJK11_08960 [Balneola sp.]
MKYIRSTYEILALRCMDESIDERHSNWAVEMLKAGFETDHLASLVLLEKPIDQFEIKHLVDVILKELDLDYKDNTKVLYEYSSYFIKKYLNKEIPSFKLLHEIKKLYLFLDYDYNLSPFYLLYHAKIDLDSNGYQHYYDGANSENIDSKIFDECLDWLENYPVK